MDTKIYAICTECGDPIYQKDVHLKYNKPCHVKCDDDIPIMKRTNKTNTKMGQIK